MAVDFFESPAFSPSWSHEENSLAAEITYNGDLINWDYWAGLSNISPEQAAKLCWAIDPIKWSANSYALGDVPNELSEKIQRLEQWLKSRFSSLSLSDLIDAVGKDKAPTGMIEAVESKSIDEAKKHSSDIQPLEQLTKEERSNYNSRAAWTWVDAIYILQGYKPAYQLSTEQVRSHFPDWVKYFTDSLLLGTVGKETMQAGQRIFIDSPANWQAFWQIIHKTPEPKAEAVEKLSLDNELDTILDIGLHDAFNELKQRNEAPYDGVLGCPPDSITENEKERFESIRNRLLVGECFTDAYIRGLINDCDSNTHSFSLIPNRLKQDIRFLASLWRATNKDRPKAEAVVNTAKADTHKPWQIPDPRDPEPEHPWYVAARYFARQLVLEDSSLLLKREILAGKVTKSLDKVNIKKRGGIKSFNPATVKKALANVILG